MRIPRWMERERTLCRFLIGRVRVRLEFKIEDCWVGVFFRGTPSTIGGDTWWNIWICLVPCLPLHIDWHHWRSV